jgi:dipeptidyl aminopeptidase/acylaminoacyl peptidase
MTQTAEQAAPARPRPTFAQFTAVRRYQPTLSFSPDGSEIAYSVNTSGQYNLWRQSSAGGYPRQLTLSADQAVRQVAWSPDGQTLLFTADNRGDEFTKVYALLVTGGQPLDVATQDQVQYQIPGGAWSPDGRAVAYAGNDREPTDQDVIIQNLATSETTRPLTGDGIYAPVAWSPDGSKLLAMQVYSNTNFDVYLIDVAASTARLLTEHEGEIKQIPVGWAADGLGFYLVSDRDREFTGLAFYQLDGDVQEWVETPEWDVEDAVISADGRWLVWAVNEDGYSRVKARNLTTMETADVTLPDGVLGAMALAPAGGKLALLWSQSVAPAEIFVVDLITGKVNQITESFLGGIDSADLTKPTLTHYPTFDGKQIPALLYRPADTAGKMPVILSIHGGPEAQERPSYAYSGLYQYLASRGIAVLAPNIRGSTGYGKTYQALIHRDWGGDELKDLEAAAQYLRSLDWVDPDRIGVFGGSFGGFATLSCVSRLPDYWAAAVDVVGPSHLVTLTRSVPPTWRRMMAAWVGDPETEADFLMERSPITYVEHIKAPLFVIQGANDPRVVKAESDQIVDKLRARGVEVRYDVYDDEGHGFTKRENELKAWGDTAAFFEEHLLGSAG